MPPGIANCPLKGKMPQAENHYLKKDFMLRVNLFLKTEIYLDFLFVPPNVYLGLALLVTKIYKLATKICNGTD